ncbi:transposase [Streptomyces bluensis]|uniref:transposase n=1 Tax=Streptomyces bluensis TaxID=33897 RepID=UPI0033184258
MASSGRTVTEVARELGISSESPRGWVKKANSAGQTGARMPVAAGSGLDAAEREELKRLRKLAADQAKTIEILKKATAFFAKESDR